MKNVTEFHNQSPPPVTYILIQVMMLYTKIEALSDDYKYDVDVSYVEIYNENMKDLLSPGETL